MEKVESSNGREEDDDAADAPIVSAGCFLAIDFMVAEVGGRDATADDAGLGVALVDVVPGRDDDG